MTIIRVKKNIVEIEGIFIIIFEMYRKLSSNNGQSDASHLWNAHDV